MPYLVPRLSTVKRLLHFSYTVGSGYGISWCRQWSTHIKLRVRNLMKSLFKQYLCIHRPPPSWTCGSGEFSDENGYNVPCLVDSGHVTLPYHWLGYGSVTWPESTNHLLLLTIESSLLWFTFVITWYIYSSAFE